MFWNQNSESFDKNVNIGCYFMTFDQSASYLVASFQNFDVFFNKEAEDKEKYVAVWNLESGSEESNKDTLKKIQMEMFEFADLINAQHRILLPRQLQVDKQFQIRPNQLSSIMPHLEGKFYLLGSSYGDLSIVKPEFLTVEDDFNPETCPLTAYSQAKNYAGHCSPVENIRVSGAKLFTSAAHCEDIFEWNLEIGQKEWELDHRDYDMDMEDILLRGIESKDEYTKLVSDILPLRNEIVELGLNIDTSIDPEVSLTLEKVIGRMAFNRRKNLLYTEDNHLIFPVASQIVKMSIPPEGFKLDEESRKQFFKLSFLSPDSRNEFNVNPQISTLALSKDRKYLAVGTIQTKAKIITWELTSYTYLDSITFEDCCVIQNISFSGDMKRIVAVILTKDYTQRLYLLETRKLEVIGMSELGFSTPVKIKDAMFVHKSNSEFITIGLQHMTRWSYEGGLLMFQELPIENPNDIIERAGVLHIIHEREHRMRDGKYKPTYDDQGREVFPLNVTFLAFIFLYEELIITGGDDGYVSYNFDSPDFKALHLEELQDHQEEKRPP